MRIHSVHARELPVPPERVGALLDGLASDDDRLWPVDRWPTNAIELDRPLAVGASGGHGSTRYSVAAYEPGTSVVFAFTPGSGLRGTHGFEVEALGRKRTRLRHTLDTELERKLVLLRPILLGYHDALVEDILDRAQLVTTGRLDEPARHPIWLRCLNGLEIRLARLRRKHGPPRTDVPQRGRRRLLGVLVPATLAGLAALHGAWALGWRWPGGSDQELADYVVGYGARLPSAGLTWAVAVLLLAAAATVRAGVNGARGPLRKAAWGVSGVLLARALVSIPVDLARGLEDVYDRLDLAIYSPLCLALGLATAWLLTRGRGHARGDQFAAMANS